MRRLLRMSVVLLALALAPAIDAVAADHGTADEAKANKDFHDRDLYVFVRSMDGNTVAHGVNKAMIGHTSLESKDADGKHHNKEILETAAAKGSGGVDYRWPDPVDKKIEQKSSYVQKVGDYVIGSGIYK